MKILITGAAGVVGRTVAKALAHAGHEVRGFDLRPTLVVSDHVVGSLMDAAALDRGLEGRECLIHLAACPDDADFMTELLPNNIVGLYNVLEAARRAGVGRVILASSGQVTWGQHLNGPWPSRVTSQPTPKSWYAVTKLFAENAGRIYAERHNMDVLAVRLGACPRSRQQADEIFASEIIRDLYFSPRDLERFFVQAVAVPPGFGFRIVYASSRPTLRQRSDLESARQLLGYEPQDTWPEYLEEYWK
jgi:nucleoside-diphosphate-sugar epimerase